MIWRYISRAVLKQLNYSTKCRIDIEEFHLNNQSECSNSFILSVFLSAHLFVHIIMEGWMLGPPFLIGEKVFYSKNGTNFMPGTVRWLGKLQDCFGNQMVAGVALVSRRKHIRQLLFYKLQKENLLRNNSKMIINWRIVNSIG